MAFNGLYCVAQVFLALNGSYLDLQSNSALEWVGHAGFKWIFTEFEISVVVFPLSGLAQHSKRRRKSIFIASTLTLLT